MVTEVAVGLAGDGRVDEVVPSQECNRRQEAEGRFTLDGSAAVVAETKPSLWSADKVSSVADKDTPSGAVETVYTGKEHVDGSR